MSASPELRWVAHMRKYIGQREIKGPQHNKVIMSHIADAFIATKQKQWIFDDETAYCFPGEVEILTELGWQRFDSLTADKVYQADENGNLSITEYIPVQKDYNGPAYWVKHRGIDLVCDKGHRWWGNLGKSKNPSFTTLDKIGIDGFGIPKTFSSNDDYDISDRNLMLLAAYISDGSLKRVSLNVTDIFISVSKLRKVLHLDTLEADHRYEEKRVYGTRKKPMVIYKFKKFEGFDSLFIDYKELDPLFINKLSLRQVRLFLKTYNLYDGNGMDTGCVLYTARESGVRFLTHMLVMAGYHHNVNIKKGGEFSKKTHYCITYTQYKATKHIERKHIEEIPYNGNMYCVTVPHGRIIVKSRGGAIVVGNCGSFLGGVYAKTGLGSKIPKMFPRAKEWAKAGTPLKSPAYGCVVVFSRKGGGHVGICVGKTSTGLLKILGANQSDEINITDFPTSDVIAYRWIGDGPNPAQHRFDLPVLPAGKIRTNLA